MRVQTANRLSLVNEYYFSSRLAQIRKENARGGNIINLGIGNPDMSPDLSVIQEASDSAFTGNSHGYQPYRSIPELRQAFGRWYKQMYNVNLDSEKEILPLIGSKEGIMHISMAFLNPGDGVLIPDPGYPAYEAVAGLCNARVQHYNLSSSKGWLPDFTELESLDLCGVKLMWVNYPNMPTGVSPERDTFRKLLDFGKANNILIINDNPYSLILSSNADSILSEEDALSGAMELNSLSKSHNMAGWRIGMLAASEDNINSILKVKSNMDSGMHLPLQKAAIKALDLPRKWYSGLNSIYRKRQKLVFDLLDKLGSVYSTRQSGLFVWSELPGAWKSSFDFSDHLLETTGVFITPGSVFGANGRNYIRTSLCAPEDKILEARERIRSKF